MRDIVFFSQVDGVADAYPVMEAKNYHFNWIEKAREDYKSHIKNNKNKRSAHIYRCPGIFDLLSTGYIVPMPWDVKITTNGDYRNFSWEIPTGDIAELFPTDVVTGHLADEVAKNLPKKHGSLGTIVKLNSPWHIIAPSDVKFLINPIPYPDSYEFESTIGILEPSLSSETNFQLRWNVLNGTHIVKAGTPMFHLIPLTSEKFNLIVRNANENDKKWLEKRRYLNNCTFSLDRPLVKRIFKKFFGV